MTKTRTNIMLQEATGMPQEISTLEDIATVASTTHSMLMLALDQFESDIRYRNNNWISGMASERMKVYVDIAQILADRLSEVAKLAQTSIEAHFQAEKATKESGGIAPVNTNSACQ